MEEITPSHRQIGGSRMNQKPFVSITKRGVIFDKKAVALMELAAGVFVIFYIDLDRLYVAKTDADGFRIRVLIKSDKKKYSTLGINSALLRDLFWSRFQHMQNKTIRYPIRESKAQLKDFPMFEILIHNKL